MNRLRLILTIFVTCLAVMLTAMAWVSVVVIKLDRRDAEAQRQAELQENARLALWRMDSALGPIIAQENTRPYYEYRSFYSPPVAFDATHRLVPGGAVMLPSALLLQQTPFVKLHFQIDSKGRISSPQVPEGVVPESMEAQFADRNRLTVPAISLSELSRKLDRGTLLAVAPEPDDESTERMPSLDNVEPAGSAQAATEAQRILNELNASNDLRQSSIPLASQQSGRARNARRQQQLRSNAEFQQRAESNTQNTYLSKQNRFGNSFRQQPAPSADALGSEAKVYWDIGPADTSVVREGDVKPVWVDGELLLVRRVTMGEQTWVQGCWLDWQAIRVWLLKRVSDLLPHAQLTPVAGTIADADSGSPHLLAMLPVSLVPGTLNGSGDRLSLPIRTSLIVAWTCTLLAVAAVVLLVIGMAALSERRAAFVSAVTHELRTPLTTFRMYTEMLADGMVTDDERRREYLATLCAESNRLAQLVENVLSYARLERNRTSLSAQETTAGEMIDRFTQRLRQRTEQAEMELTIELDDAAGDATLHTDVSAVEQIVFNLVDNACKYAAQAEDRRIHVAGQIDARRFRLSVTDHGPGVGQDVGRRLFRPFSKSAQTAANSAPGVGLGLALSRRLARRLGGDLRLKHSNANGCCFELTIGVRHN